jgi:hypothetical protein
MFKKLFLSQFVILFSTLSFASLQGQWSGWGTWTFDGSGTSCRDMRLSFDESAGALARSSGHFECDVVALDLPAQSWTKKGPDLLLDGAAIGSVKGDVYQWTEPYNPTVSVRTTITVSGDHLDYQELWIQKDGSTLYDIEGRLFRMSDNPSE